MAITPADLEDCLIYQCLIGSRAYGLEVDSSDEDRRGIFLPPAHMHWSLDPLPQTIDHPETQTFHWEIEKFLRLALQANPTVLEVLYSPLPEHITPLGQELLDLRRSFLTRQIYQTFHHYALSQYQKMQQRMVNQQPIKWKHAMHLIRLLITGLQALRQGELNLRISEPDDVRRLMLIRHGEMPWEEIDRWRLVLHAQFEESCRSTNLPEQPDWAAANAFLIKARKAATEDGWPQSMNNYSRR